MLTEFSEISIISKIRQSKNDASEILEGLEKSKYIIENKNFQHFCCFRLKKTSSSDFFEIIIWFFEKCKYKNLISIQNYIILHFTILQSFENENSYVSFFEIFYVG